MFRSGLLKAFLVFAYDFNHERAANGTWEVFEIWFTHYVAAQRGFSPHNPLLNPCKYPNVVRTLSFTKP